MNTDARFHALQHRHTEISPEPLEEAIKELFVSNKLTLSLAESCTGGAAASRLISVPGASEYMQGAVVSYSNESKQAVLHVAPTTLEKYGAVSCEVTEEMAAGVQKLFLSTVAASISGILGPSGGSKAKPIGTIALSIFIEGACVYSRLLQLADDLPKEKEPSRATLCEYAVQRLLEEIYFCVKKRLSA